MTPFKFVGAKPRDLSTGRPLAFGDVVDLPDPLHPADAALVSEGELIPVEPTPKPRARRRKNTTAPTSAPDPEEHS